MDNMVRKVTVYVVTAELGEISVQVCYESLLSPSTFTHTHRADNTTSCDAFLCDVKPTASGLRDSAQDV